MMFSPPYADILLIVFIMISCGINTFAETQRNSEKTGKIPLNESELEFAPNPEKESRPHKGD